MPRSKTKTAIENLEIADLAYAVRRLVSMHKTAENEVLKLAAERGERIAALQAELKALTVGTPVRAAVAATVPAAKPAAKKAAPRKAAAPAPSHAQAVVRKLQGKYMGLLRNFVGATREHIKRVNKDQGLAAGIAEMTRLLATKAAPRKAAPQPAPRKPAPAARKAAAKPAAPAKPAARPAPRKLRITPQRAAQLKAQGMYIGLLRSLPVTEKAKIKALAKDKGMAAAVAAMLKKRGGK